MVPPSIVPPASPGRWRPLILALAVALTPLLITSCTDVPKRTGDLHSDLKSSDPLIRGESAMHAGRLKVASTIPLLIELLEDDDYGVRLNAHIALLLITDERSIAYQALDPPKLRKEGADRWREWYAGISQ